MLCDLHLSLQLTTLGDFSSKLNIAKKIFYKSILYFSFLRHIGHATAIIEIFEATHAKR